MGMKGLATMNFLSRSGHFHWILSRNHMKTLGFFPKTLKTLGFLQIPMCRPYGLCSPGKTMGFLQKSLETIGVSWEHRNFAGKLLYLWSNFFERIDVTRFTVPTVEKVCAGFVVNVLEATNTSATAGVLCSQDRTMLTLIFKVITDQRQRLALPTLLTDW